MDHEAAPKVLHQFNVNTGQHRLVVNDQRGKWATYRDIAELANMRATTDYYNGVLPAVFQINIVDYTEENT